MEVFRFTIGQLTPFERGEGYTAIASLPQGLVTDAVQPQLRIAGAVPGETVSVHYTRQGLKWPGGSWRQCQIQFYALLGGGQPGVRGYEHAFERELVLEEGVGSIPLPTHQVHASVDLSQLRFEFQTQMQGIAHRYAPGGYHFGEPGQVHVWRLDPLMSTWRDITAPYTERSEARRECDHSAAANGNCFVRRYQVNARLLPEGENPPNPPRSPEEMTEPSLCGRLTYEVYHAGIPGAARKVRCWLEIANTLVTEVESPRAPNYPMGRWLSPPVARIYSADPVNHPIRVAIFGEDALLPEPPRTLSLDTDPVLVGRGIEWDLTSFDENASNANRDLDRAGYNSFHDGMDRVYQCAIYFTGGDELDPIEQSTLAAMMHAPTGGSVGEDCVCYAGARSLNVYDTFGAFGQVPSVDDPGFGWSMDDLRDRTAAMARRDRDDYRQRDPWQEQRLSTPKYTADPGAQKGHGAITGMQWAMSGHWDLRAWWISCSQEAWRWWHFRYLNGETWRFDEMRRSGTPAQYQSSVHFNGCRPFYVNEQTAYPDTPISISGGRTWFHNLGKWGRPNNSETLVEDYDISTPRGLNDNSVPSRNSRGVQGHNFQHFVINNLIFLAHYAGDAWLLESELLDQMNIVMCTRQIDDQELEFAPFVSTELCVDVPRGEGRVYTHYSHVHTLVTDEGLQDQFFQRARDRMSARLYWGTTDGAPGGNMGDRQQDLYDELSEITRDNEGYWTNNNKFFLADGVTPAWSSADGRADSYAPWHIGRLVQGCYAQEVVAQYDQDPVRREDALSLGRQLGELLVPNCPKNGCEFVDPVTGYRFYYAVPADIPYLERGAAPPPSAHGQSYPGGVFFWQRGQLIERTDLGPPIPGSSGIPWFQRGGPDIGVKWPYPTVILALRYAPNDEELRARIVDLMENYPLFPTGEALLDDFFSATAPWVSYTALVPRQFEVPSSQSRIRATMPSPRARGVGQVSVPSISGSGRATMPSPAARVRGTAAPNASTGTGRATMPSPAAVGVGTIAAPAVTGVGRATMPSPGAFGQGAARLVINEAKLRATMPSPVAVGVGRAYAPVARSVPSATIARFLGGPTGSFATSSYGEPGSVIRGSVRATMPHPTVHAENRFGLTEALQRDLAAVATTDAGETVLFLPAQGQPVPVRAIVNRPEPFGGAAGRVVTTIRLLVARGPGGIIDVSMGEDAFLVEIFKGRGVQRCPVTNIQERAATHWILEVNP